MDASALPTEGRIVEGPAFPLLVKLLATVLIGALVVWGLRVAGQLAEVDWTPAAMAFLGATLVMIGVCYWWILRSRTTIDATHIRQTWIWRKEVALADVAHIKMVFVPFMDWLIAPRMVVRVRGRGVLVFHAADSELLRAFALLSFNVR